MSEPRKKFIKFISQVGVKKFVSYLLSRGFTIRNGIDYKYKFYKKGALAASADRLSEVVLDLYDERFISNRDIHKYLETN